MVEEFNEKVFEKKGKALPETNTVTETKVETKKETEQKSTNQEETQSETQLDENTMNEIEHEVSAKENSDLNELKDTFTKQFQELQEVIKNRDEEVSKLTESLSKQSELLSNMSVREPKGMVAPPETKKELTPQEIRDMDERELEQLFSEASLGVIKEL